MLNITFIAADGSQKLVEAPAGERLLDIAQAAGQPLEGTCEGQMACSTCHVIFTPEDFAKLDRATEMEEDMLDLAVAVTRHSRLSCQIVLKEEWQSLTVRIPPERHDMSER